MKRLIITVGVLSLLTVGGIYGYQWVMKQKALLTDFCFKFHGYKANTLSLTRVNIEITLAIKNRSAIDLKVDGYDFDVFIGANKLTNIQAKESVALKSGQWADLTLVIDVNPTKVGKNIISSDLIGAMLVDRGSIIIGINGTVSASALGVEVKHMPINVSMPLSQFSDSPPSTPDPSKAADCA